MEWNGMDSQKSSIGRARHMAHPPHMVAIRRPSSKTKGLQGSKVNKKKSAWVEVTLPIPMILPKFKGRGT